MYRIKIHWVACTTCHIMTPANELRCQNCGAIRPLTGAQVERILALVREEVHPEVEEPEGFGDDMG